MIKPSKAMIAGAAVSGLLAGSMAVRTYAASRTRSDFPYFGEPYAKAEQAVSSSPSPSGQ